MNEVDLQGHWRRAWIRTAEKEDQTTEVHWLQCRDYFVDIRIPADGPKISGVNCLAELNAATLLEVLRARGFAGRIGLRDDVCTWHRVIDWHGADGCTDAGTLSWGDDGALREDGVFASYSEKWIRAGNAPFRVHGAMSSDDQTLLIEDGEHFLFGNGPRCAFSTVQLMRSLQEHRLPREDLIRLFASEYSFGVCEYPVGRITLSTNPLRIGEVALQAERDGTHVLSTRGYNGESRYLRVAPIREGVDEW